MTNHRVTFSRAVDNRPHSATVREARLDGYRVGRVLGERRLFRFEPDDLTVAPVEHFRTLADARAVIRDRFEGDR
jgi:hypothetical protein